MKKLIALFLIFLPNLTLGAQNTIEPFRAYLYNNEYEVYLRIDFYDETIIIPGQELYGQLPGYLGKKNNTFCWIITSAKVQEHTAHLSMINDYGSEDLTAVLEAKNDSLYELRQVEGSTLKVPKNGKWQKLPKTLEFKRR